jgi:hypothetical protein
MRHARLGLSSTGLSNASRSRLDRMAAALDRAGQRDTYDKLLRDRRQHLRI